jgi:hypothetical protein
VALTLRNSTLTNPADKTEIEENFADVVDKFNAGITTADLSAAAGIVNAQLANSHFEMFVKFQIRSTTTAPGAAGLQLVDYYPLPDITNGAYTIVGADYYATDQGATANFTVSIASGTVSAGAFSVTTTHVNAQTIAFGTDGNDILGSFTVADTAIPASANNRVMRCVVTLGNADQLSTIGDTLVIVLKLKRTLGLRS